MASMAGLPPALLALLLLVALAVVCVVFVALAWCVSAVAKRWGDTPAALLVVAGVYGFLYLLVVTL